MYRLLPLLLIVGCLGSGSPTQSPIQNSPAPFVPSDSVQKIGVPATTLATIHGILGPSNTITISEPMSVKGSGVTVTTPANCKVSYTTTETLAQFKFSNPKPVVTYGILHPILDELDLIDDKTAVASVTEGFIHKKVRFTYSVTETAASVGTEEDTRPVMYVWGDPVTCVPCKQAHDALDAAKDLPFRPVYNPPGIPNPYPSEPSFAWSRTQMPSANMRQNWTLNAWTGLDHLVKEFKKTRQVKVGWHSHTCPNPLCRTTWSHPDNSPTASHNCPKCGTYQDIQDS